MLLLSSLLLAACTPKQPQITLETETFDFGDVVNGDIVSQDLVVRNEGNEPLVVETVSTSCGCTTATLEPMTISAGGTATLRVEFDSGAHGPDLSGQVIRQIFLSSNDPQRPEAIVEFSANILAKP
jgi:hypothetical protein